MGKAITFMLLILIVDAICIGIMAGGGGIVSTKLSADITSENTTLIADNTTGFLASDIIVIDEEEIGYTSRTSTTFTGLVRGYGDTEADEHDEGSFIYTKDSAAVNNAMGFSIVQTTDSMGAWAAPAIPILFLVKTIPRAIANSDFGLMSSGLAMLSYFFLAMFAGIIITLAISLAGGRRVS